MSVLASLLVVLAVLALCSSKASASCEQALAYVKPTIGTTGLGYAGGQGSPAAQVPFGALRLGPDTTNNTLDLGYRHASGYNWVDANIRAFSHTRLVDAGVSDLGNFGVMPTSRRSLRDDLKEALKSHLWTSHYVKSSESAAPGKYSVYMDSIDVQADMLAFDQFAGVHRYTWNPENKYGSTAAASIADNTAPGLVIDVCHAADEAMKKDGGCLQSSFTLGKDRRSFSASVLLHGGLSGRGKDGGIRAYLYGQFVLPKELGADGATALDWLVCADEKNCHFDFRSEEPVIGQSGQLLTHVRFLNRPTSTPFSVELMVGLSFISEAQAKDNLLGALADAAISRDTTTSVYDKLVSKSQKSWCDALGNVQFEDFATAAPSAKIPDPSNRPEEKKDFLTIAYSALYRTLLSPTQYTERNGYYLGLDNQVHNSVQDRSEMKSFGSNSFNYFSDLSLWDTFRTQHPWLLLTRPDVAVGTLRSMAEMSKQSGRFPKWVLGSIESGCMIGIHGLAAVVEAIYAGYGDSIDVASMQAAALAQCTDPAKTDRNDLERYLSDGYVSLESADNSASLTLSYAFDDHSLSIMSSYVGDTASASAALNRSLNNYRTIWSSSQEIMCPRLATGELKCPSSSTSVVSFNYYTEGDPEHWRWFVPQDIEGLIGLFSSKQRFEEVLENFFAQHVPFYEKFGEGAPNPYYWAGNEVDLLTPYMFNYGTCTRSQYWARTTLDMHYNSMANGLPGNDDYGTMSANIIFTSLGFYPLAGSSTFFIGSPRVSKARVYLQDQSTHRSAPYIDVIAYNNTKDSVYVEKLLVNGVELKTPFIDRGVLTGQFPVEKNDIIKSIPLDDPRRSPVLNPMKGAKLEFFMSSTPKSGLCADM